MSAVDWARTQLGVHESPSGSNRNPYGAEYGLNGVSWCLQFCWAAWLHGRGVNLRQTITPNCAGVDGFWRAAQSKRLTVANPRADDIVIYHFPHEHAGGNHAGIVTGDRGSTIDTIEGNTSAGSDAHGGEVMSRNRSKALVLGYVRPVAPLPAPTPIPSPLPEDDDMLRLIKNPHAPGEVWLTNGMVRRPMRSPTEAVGWQLLGALPPLGQPVPDVLPEVFDGLTPQP